MNSVVFQQDLEPLLEESGMEDAEASSLAIRCCAGFCYFMAMTRLGWNPGFSDGDFLDFIIRIYQPDAPGAHELGVNHNEMAPFVYNLSEGSISAIVLDPLREHFDTPEFKLKGSYAGAAALNFFASHRTKLNSGPTVVNAIKEILSAGGLAIVGLIQKGTNGYIGDAAVEGETPTHTFLCLDYLESSDEIVYLDPDRRAFENPGGRRPPEITPLEGKPGYYKIKADFLESHARKVYGAGTNQEREGGIIIGLFRNQNLA